MGAPRLPLAAALALILGLALIRPGTLPARAAAPPAYVYAQHPCTAAADAPSASAPLLTEMLGGTQLPLVGTARAADGGTWDHVKLWGAIDAYVAAGDAGASRPDANQLGGESADCSFPGLPDTAPDVLPPDPGPFPLSATGAVIAPTSLLAAPDPGAFPLASADQGAPVDIAAWAADGSGMPWYQVALDGDLGWIPATSVAIDQPDPATYAVAGVPVWEVSAGKAMWLKNYSPHHSDVDAMVQAAQFAGLTHLEVEVAISQFGFYARNTLDRLLPAAHAAGLKVIAFVYPTLAVVAADVRLTQEVAAYRTPSGDRVDGIGTDIEENLTEANVYAYGQLLRALLGPDVPLVANVFNAVGNPDYPYAAIAASWNVLAPMDYWHGQQGRTYGSDDVAGFVATSITTIRAAVGPDLPIEELGQTYDIFGPDGVAVSNAPSGQEMRADLAVAHQLGCIGASFFEWETTTPDEWQAIANTPW
jgi:hypothetical protein